MREYKLVVHGSRNITQLIEGSFIDNLKHFDPHIMEDSFRKQIEVDGELAMLEILDLVSFPGPEDSQVIKELYIKNKQGFVLVYSIAAQSTFNDLTEFRDQILRIKETDDVPMVLVGNKCDLEDERVVDKLEGQNLAKQFGNCTFLETSAKLNINVNEIFHDLVRQINQREPECNRAKHNHKLPPPCIIL